MNKQKSKFVERSIFVDQILKIYNLIDKIILRKLLLTHNIPVVFRPKIKFDETFVLRISYRHVFPPILTIFYFDIFIQAL